MGRQCYTKTRVLIGLECAHLGEADVMVGTVYKALRSAGGLSRPLATLAQERRKHTLNYYAKRTEVYD